MYSRGVCYPSCFRKSATKEYDIHTGICQVSNAYFKVQDHSYMYFIQYWIAHSHSVMCIVFRSENSQ
jgi:hypothetical protein